MNRSLIEIDMLFELRLTLKILKHINVSIKLKNTNNSPNF